MTIEHRNGIGSLPDDLVRLDRELRGIQVEERASFSEELRVRLVDEHRRRHRKRVFPGRAFPRRRQLIPAAAVVALLTVSLGVPPVRASLARLLGLPLAEGPQPAQIAPGSAIPTSSGMEGAGRWEGTANVTPPRPTRGLGESPEMALPLPATPPRLADPDEARRTVAGQYPPLLQRAGIGGTVGVLVWVDSGGSPESPQVVVSSDVGQLDAAALSATRGLRFAPATRGGQPVGVWVEFSIIFRPEAEEPGSGSGQQESPVPPTN